MSMLLSKLNSVIIKNLKLEQKIAKLLLDKKDAERYRYIASGKAFTVKTKSSTIIFAPNIEKDFGIALETSLDYSIADSASKISTQ